MKKRAIKFILKLGVSIAFLGWIIFKVDWASVFELLKKIDMIYVGIYFILLVFGMGISAYKWKILAEFKGIDLSFSRFFQLYLTGTFINNFMPSFVGGDAYRIYQAGKESKSYSQSAAAVVMDRLTGLFGALVLVIFFAIVNFSMIMEHDVLLVLNAIIALVVLAVIIFMLSRKSVFWEKLLNYFKVKKALSAKISDFAGEILHYSGDTKIVWKSLMWSMLFGIVGIAMVNAVLFSALGIHVDALDYLSVIFMISFVSSLPISINNIGVKEWAYVTFFGFFGVSSSAVVTVAILSRFLQMIFSFLAWPLYLRDKKA